MSVREYNVLNCYLNYVKIIYEIKYLNKIYK